MCCNVVPSICARAWSCTYLAGSSWASFAQSTLASSWSATRITDCCNTLRHHSLVSQVIKSDLINPFLVPVLHGDLDLQVFDGLPLDLVFRGLRFLLLGSRFCLWLSLFRLCLLLLLWDVAPALVSGAIRLYAQAGSFCQAVLWRNLRYLRLIQRQIGLRFHRYLPKAERRAPAPRSIRLRFLSSKANFPVFRTSVRTSSNFKATW
jgi:hypothetical protein